MEGRNAYSDDLLAHVEERPMSWKRGKVLGVFEITQDVTHDYATIRRFQWIVAMSFLGLWG